MTGYIMRLESGDQGTFGRLLAPRFDGHTLEPPWRGNRPNISCIPAGTYKAVVRQSPRFGTVYHVTDVSGRSWILTHSGNLGGDESEGWKSHTEGCILIGGYRGILTVRGRTQKAVLYSRPTFDRFMEAMGGGEFTLKIMEAWK